MLLKKFIIKFNKQMQKNQKPIKPQDFTNERGTARLLNFSSILKFKRACMEFSKLLLFLEMSHARWFFHSLCCRIPHLLPDPPNQCIYNSAIVQIFVQCT